MVQNTIINLFKSVNVIEKLGSNLKCLTLQLQYVLAKFKSDSVENKGRSGLPKSLKPREVRQVLQQISEDLTTSTVTTVTPQTIRHYLHNNECKARVQRKKPLISEKAGC